MALDSFKFHLIQQRREKLKLTLLDVTFALRQIGTEVSPATILRWEEGSTAPDADKVPALAKVLGITPEEFYG